MKRSKPLRRTPFKSKPKRMKQVSDKRRKLRNSAEGRAELTTCGASKCCRAASAGSLAHLTHTTLFMTGTAAQSGLALMLSRFASCTTRTDPKPSTTARKRGARSTGPIMNISKKPEKRLKSAQQRIKWTHQPNKRERRWLILSKSKNKNTFQQIQ